MTLLARAALAACLTITPASAGEDVLRVTVDQAKIATLPPGAASLVIGNPAVADVTMIRNVGRMVLTGRGYGETNLIALDAQGLKIDEKRVLVDPPKHVLVVQRGDARQSYSCDPVCMPTAALGDDTKVFSDVSAEVVAHGQLAQPKDNGSMQPSVGGDMPPKPSVGGDMPSRPNGGFMPPN